MSGVLVVSAHRASSMWALEHGHHDDVEHLLRTWTPSRLSECVAKTSMVIITINTIPILIVVTTSWNVDRKLQ